MDKVQTKVPCGYEESFGLSCEDAQDKDNWRLKKNQGGNRLTHIYLEKWPLNAASVPVHKKTADISH